MCVCLYVCVCVCMCVCVCVYCVCMCVCFCLCVLVCLFERLCVCANAHECTLFLDKNYYYSNGIIILFANNMATSARLEIKHNS